MRAASPAEAEIDLRHRAPLPRGELCERDVVERAPDAGVDPLPGAAHVAKGFQLALVDGG
jgi:hypothetical protein